MVAVKNIEETDILGHLMWFSVGKQLVNSQELFDKLVASGLEESWMPNRIRSVDAFRRATKEVECRKATDKANVFKNYIIREVYSDKEMVQRNIVCETVDQKGKRLAYDSEAAVIKMDKKNDGITVAYSDDFTKGLCEEIERRFNIYKDHYSAQQVRVMINKILQSLAPVPVRPNGGIYFVPSSHTEQLKKLIDFTSSLENSEGFKVPVVDTFDNREMVIYKLDQHMEEIINQCRSSEGLGKAQIKELIVAANKVVSDYREYQGIVNVRKDDFEKKIDILRVEISKLIANVED